VRLRLECLRKILWATIANYVQNSMDGPSVAAQSNSGITRIIAEFSGLEYDVALDGQTARNGVEGIAV
jgi:hypothetical protein